MIKYLQAGARINSNFVVNLGPTATIGDIAIDGTASQDYGDGVGDIWLMGRRPGIDDEDRELSYVVNFDAGTGMFWYDDEKGE